MMGVDSPGNVLITIKAPNQKVDDMVINCDPNWTVEELKLYLSRVYPSKPHPQGQKLIYSGKLLIDTLKMNEVLKCYNGQQNNTIHLVCSSTKEPVLEYKNPIPQRESTSGPSQDSVPQSDASTSTGDRYRTDANVRDLILQRNYMTYLFLQYIAYYSQPGVQMNEPREEPQFTDTRPEPPQNPPVNNDNLVPDEDRLPNRDWLDWVYIGSRLVVLSTLVYFYSSPVRCFLVTVMAFILYHLGMFRWRRAEVNAVNANQLNNNNNNDNGVFTERNVRERVDVITVGDGVMQFRERFGWMKILFNFLMSFVLSLNPDRDN